VSHMRKPSRHVEQLLYSVSHAARMIGFSRSKTYEMIRDGIIPHIVIDGLIRVRLKDLQALIDGGTR
jgi:excisionase family DNA binding protein